MDSEPVHTKEKSRRHKPKSPRTASDHLVKVSGRRKTKSDGKKEAVMRNISFDDGQHKTDCSNETVIVHNPYGLISSDVEEVDITKYMEKVTHHGQPIKPSPTLGRKKSVMVTLNPKLVPDMEKKEARKINDRRSAARLCRLDKPQTMNSKEDTSKSKNDTTVCNETRLVIMDRGVRLQYPYTIADARHVATKNIKRIKCEDGELYCIYEEKFITRFLAEFLKPVVHKENMAAIKNHIYGRMKEKKLDDDFVIDGEGMVCIQYSTFTGTMVRLFYMLYLELLKNKLESLKKETWKIGSVVDTCCLGLYEVHQALSEECQSDSEDHVPAPLFIKANHVFIQLFLQSYVPITPPKKSVHLKMTTM